MRLSSLPHDRAAGSVEKVDHAGLMAVPVVCTVYARLTPTEPFHMEYSRFACIPEIAVVLMLPVLAPSLPDSDETISSLD